ncbi:MAG: hypothetical protein K2R98_31125 [Gemmataceae bacterium]|nr:hypothetical protein [Gemmataceae bacterium]
MIALLSLVLVFGADAPDLETTALKKLNAFRKAADLSPVTLDADLSKACQLHAEYLAKNFALAFKGQLDVHDEDAKLPGFTAEGRKAAKSSVISQMKGRGDPLIGIDVWMGSFYHRVPLLDPNLTKVGIGSGGKPEDGHSLVLDSTNGKIKSKDANKIVCYPVKDQKDVPRVFCLGSPEFPNPLPNNGKSADAGYPITASFFLPKVVIKDATATLQDAAGKDVEVWLSWPEKPAVKNYGGNSICAIPKAPLKANTEYTVTLTAKVNNRDWKSSWSFTTGPK